MSCTNLKGFAESSPTILSDKTYYMLINSVFLHIILKNTCFSFSGYPQGSQDQLDSKCCPQAPRDAWSYLRRPQFPWSGQGSQILTDQGRLPPRRLDPPQHAAAPPQAINVASDKPLTFYLIFFILTWKASV